jgi:hypothetical protein
MKNIIVYVRGYTETDTIGMLSLPIVWRKVSLFRADSLDRYLLQCAQDSSVVVMDKMVVGLNVATCSCNVYPDKCWFAVLCRFWLQCSRSLSQTVVL